jgi:hypothetical protein
MVTPDGRGCITHGLADFRVYQYKTGRVERRCLACARLRTGYATRQFSDRCKRGHLKTPWTWRYYRPNWRCTTCHNLVRRKTA